MNFETPGTTPTLRIEVVPSSDGNAARLRLSGYLDADGAPFLGEELHRQLDAGVRQLDLDFTGVPFVSSLGIGCLIAGIGDFQESGGELAVTGLSKDLIQMLEMLDLLDYVKVR